MLNFLAISLMIFLAAFSPGPDFALVSRNALRYSQKSGIMTAYGISCSLLFHASYCILGFAIILSQSLLLFTIVKYIGASYLIYLGIKGLLEKKPNTADVVTEKVHYDLSPFQAFRQGLLCNVLNPKAIFFFLAFFTLIIKPSMALSVQIGYAIEIALIHLVWFSLVAIFFSHKKVKHVLGKFLYAITKVFGGLLVLFGLKIATLTQR